MGSAGISQGPGARRAPGLRMSADEFVAAGEALYGKRWKAPMARALGLDPATVWRYATGADIPGPVVAALRCFLREREGQPFTDA